MSAPRAASAAELATRAPMASPACLRAAPSAAGNRMSQAATVSMPVSRKPLAMAWPASPKPMKHRRGVLWFGMRTVLGFEDRAASDFIAKRCGRRQPIGSICRVEKQGTGLLSTYAFCLNNNHMYLPS